MNLSMIYKGIVLSAALVSTPVLAETAAFNADQEKQIEKVIHAYLIKNPEVIIEAIQSLQQKQNEQTKKTIQETQNSLPKFADELFHQANDPVVGNAKGKVVIVDFFDYQCPHCSKMEPTLDAVIKKNPEVKVVFKEFPIRGATSEYASKAALASQKQGKYFEFHKALMHQSTVETLNEEMILKTAKTVGLNIDKLKTDMKDPAIAQQIKNNIKLAQQLKLIGTPSFMIARSDVTNKAAVTEIIFVPGLVEQTQLEENIKKVGGK